MRKSVITRNPHFWSPLPYTKTLPILITGLVLLLSACFSNNETTPKPRAFPRVYFPEKNYLRYQSSDCTFNFEYPAYARIEKDSLFMNQKTENICWFDVVYPDYHARLHCSYYAISPVHQLDSLIYDSFALVGKHTMKAQYINETVVKLPGGGGGILFDMGGPVASPTQFFITDSTQHFLRGALYFKNRVQIDSMSVVYDFVNTDINRMLETFYWK